MDRLINDLKMWMKNTQFTINIQLIMKKKKQIMCNYDPPP